MRGGISDPRIGSVVSRDRHTGMHRLAMICVSMHQVP